MAATAATMSFGGSIATLSEKVDEALLKTLLLLEEYQVLHVAFSQQLKDGRYHLSEARHEWPNAEISASRYEGRANIRARVGVDRSFQLVPFSDANGSLAGADEEEEENEDEDETPGQGPRRRRNEEPRDPAGQPGSPAEDDPISWFGVPSRALKHCQNKFSLGTEQALQLADMRVKLESSLAQYLDLKTELDLVAKK